MLKQNSIVLSYEMHNTMTQTYWWIFIRWNISHIIQFCDIFINYGVNKIRLKFNVILISPEQFRENNLFNWVFQLLIFIMMVSVW